VGTPGEWLLEVEDSNLNSAKLHQKLMEILVTFGSKGAMACAIQQYYANAHHEKNFAFVASYQWPYTTLCLAQLPDQSHLPRKMLGDWRHRSCATLTQFASNISNQGHVALQ
jgi:hypothetical protein